MKTYHGSDRLAFVSYFNAATAVGGVVPSLPTEGSAIET